MNINTITPVLSRSWQPLTFGYGGYDRPVGDHLRESATAYKTRRERQVADARTAAEPARREAAKKA